MARRLSYVYQTVRQTEADRKTRGTGTGTNIRHMHVPLVRLETQLGQNRQVHTAKTYLVLTYCVWGLRLSRNDMYMKVLGVYATNTILFWVRLSSTHRRRIERAAPSAFHTPPPPPLSLLPQEIALSLEPPPPPPLQPTASALQDARSNSSSKKKKYQASVLALVRKHGQRKGSQKDMGGHSLT